MIHPNTIVLDLETLNSADACQHCGANLLDWLAGEDCPIINQRHRVIGWGNKVALGLSIGCYYDYADDRVHWFDERTLHPTMALLVQRQPLMVSFNGISFDFALMRAVLRAEGKQELHQLCDQFKVLAATSYDILAYILAQDPASKFERGVNSLNAVSQANGLGQKLSSGEQAPVRWANEHYADVLNYCQDDVYKTRALFEMIVQGIPLQRRNRPAALLPLPVWKEDYVALPHA